MEQTIREFNTQLTQRAIFLSCYENAFINLEVKKCEEFNLLKKQIFILNIVIENFYQISCLLKDMRFFHLYYVLKSVSLKKIYSFIIKKPF